VNDRQPIFFLANYRLLNRCLVNRVLVTLLASFIVGSILGESTEPTKIRITTWNLERFPNGSAHDTPLEIQAQRIEAAADQS